MTTPGPPKVVLLGMLSKIPVGGNSWLVGQYAVGFQRLGYDVYYVESHGRVPSMFMDHENDDPTVKAVAFIAEMMKRFDMTDRWAFHALHDDGRCYGLSSGELRRLYQEAALIINLHGGTIPREEHASTGRLVYMGTDPVELELELYRGEQHAIDFLEPHVAFFTWGLNYGNPDCQLPWSGQFPFVPSPPPVVVDFWQARGGDGMAAAFTTVGNWRQQWRDVRFRGDVYTWSKHHEFMKILELPRRVDQAFELALSSYDEQDRLLLEGHGWAVRPSLELSADMDLYRDYIARSRGELTAAKDQNVRLRTGWFSERSATYLAAGRPVVQQDTGFGNAIPTGVGVFGFADLEDAVEAIQTINADYQGNRRAAADVAREFFNYDVVLGDLLDRVGLESPVTRGCSGRTRFPPAEFPDALKLIPNCRRPLELPAETIRLVRSRPVPQLWSRAVSAPVASVVVVTFSNLTVTRLALESLLTNTTGPTFEVIVVDNASDDGTGEYLSVLAARNGNVRVIFNETNRGFAAAVNQGLSAARGHVCVILNNDTIVTPGWLPSLVAHASDPAVGLVGPVTNRCGNEAEVPTTYDTYGSLLRFARGHCSGGTFEISTSIMFCTAMRRTTFERLGPLDEHFGIGMFEDDDYSLRARQAGLQVLCARDAFVHHIGEASLGELVATGEHGELFRRNKRYFEQKWQASWLPPPRRLDRSYVATVEATRQVVDAELPDATSVLVISRGDDEFLAVATKSMQHFPANQDGTYAGYHPSSGADAVAQLEERRARGASAIVIPTPYLWWLDFYVEFREHLNSHYARVVDCDACVIYAL